MPPSPTSVITRAVSANASVSASSLPRPIRPTGYSGSRRLGPPLFVGRDVRSDQLILHAQPMEQFSLRPPAGAFSPLDLSPRQRSKAAGARPAPGSVGSLRRLRCGQISCFAIDQEIAGLRLQGADRRPHLILLEIKQVLVHSGLGSQLLIDEQALSDRLLPDRFP